MTQPATNRSIAVQNAAVLLSNYCGRTGDGAISPCAHDHTDEAQAFVRMVEQYAFPELLRALLAESNRGEGSLDLLVDEAIQELEERAMVVPER